MATASVIKIMLSSRCGDRFPLSERGSRTLSAIRVDLQKSIEAEWPFGERTFEVWINEDNIGDGGQAAWDHCMDQAVDCDIFICLFNGNAGWADKSGTIGICHAEFEKAYTVALGKVFIVNGERVGKEGERGSGLLFEAPPFFFSLSDHQTYAGDRQPPETSPEPYIPQGLHGTTPTGRSNPPLLPPQRRFSSTRSIRRRVCRNAG